MVCQVRTSRASIKEEAVEETAVAAEGGAEGAPEDKADTQE